MDIDIKKMTTNKKLEDLKEAIETEDFMYPYTSLIADKLRTIYVCFGWTHMTKDFGSAQELVERLTASVFQALLDGVDSPSWASAGLKIEGWIDEDGFVNLDYYFTLE